MRKKATPSPRSKRVRAQGRDIGGNISWSYTWDPILNAEYIKIGNHNHATGTRILREGLLIDFDALGNVIGVEILSARPDYSLPKPSNSSTKKRR